MLRCVYRCPARYCCGMMNFDGRVWLVPGNHRMFAVAFGVCAAAALLLSACASDAPRPSDPPRAAATRMPPASGFLKNTASLRPSAEHDGRWYSLSRRITGYTTYIVDKPVLLTGTTSRGVAIDPAKADELCLALRHELTQSLSSVYTLTDTPGPGVARVRTAITQIARTLPRGGGAVQEGGGTREMEIVDSVSGARLAAVIEADYGRDEHADAPTAPYHDARAAFTHWSARLMLMLREAERLATSD